MPLHVEHAPRPITLAWLDAEEAILLRCPGIGSPPGDPVPERLSSDVPSRHRAPGHVRHDPRVRPGGGIPDDRLERRREPAHERRVAELRAGDSRVRRARPVESRPAGRMTDRQLVARLRQSAGVAPERRRPSPDETG